MAEKNRYPQIPSTVWWGLRALLQRTPNATVDERLLGVSLDVQETAARAYITELKRVGLLSEDSKPTPLAHKWRIEDTYSEAVEQIISDVYPEGLRDLAPASSGDRQKAVSWFMREGLGQGAAGNKAATYLLIGAPKPMEAPTRSGGGKKGEDRETAGERPSARRERRAKIANAASERSDAKPSPELSRSPQPPKHTDLPPLNINVQIHIGSDADKAQIESIFIAMRKYLYDRPVD